MTDFYKKRGTEADLRKEMHNTMYGGYPEIAKGQQHIFRKIRRDAVGAVIKCPCVDRVTGEPDKDIYCPICMGEGNLWDEEWLTAYKVLLRADVGNASRESLLTPGYINIPMSMFFTEEPKDFTTDDRIIELLRDHEGVPIKPYKRVYVYRIDAAIDLRSDDGRLEYWKLTCFVEQRKFLNGPGG